MKTIIKTNLELHQHINNPFIEGKTVIDLNSKSVDYIIGKVPNHCIIFPDMETLAPYQKVMHDFIEHYDLDIPLPISAAHYIKSHGFFNAFNEFKQEYALPALIDWLEARDIVLLQII